MYIHCFFIAFCELISSRLITALSILQKKIREYSNHNKSRNWAQLQTIEKGHYLHWSWI
jgi:NADH:ubiquinone oxidoreductase subunit B-like Fe-S oxidoreductase